MALDSTGYLYALAVPTGVASPATSIIYVIPPGGTGTIDQQEVQYYAVSLTYLNQEIYVVSNTGSIYNLNTGDTLVTDLNDPFWLGTDGNNLYCSCEGGTSGIYKITTTEGISSSSLYVAITNPRGFGFDGNGILYYTQSAIYIGTYDGTTNNPQAYYTQGISSTYVTFNTSNYFYISSYFIDTGGSSLWISQTASCFNEDTKILCLNRSFEEEYVAIQDLKKGDLVKTYLHGYRKVDVIHQGVLLNNPNKWNQCMYKMEKTEENGLLEDLIVTGGHSILVDKFSETEKEKLNKLEVEEYKYKIDDKYLLLVSASDKFIPLTENKKYTYYHITLENNGDKKQQFGIWANGVLTETTCNDYLLNHT